MSVAEIFKVHTTLTFTHDFPSLHVTYPMRIGIYKQAATSGALPGAGGFGTGCGFRIGDDALLMWEKDGYAYGTIIDTRMAQLHFKCSSGSRWVHAEQLCYARDPDCHFGARV